MDAAFGNSRWDSEMLAMAKHAFAVNPNPDLEATAREQGWTIYFPDGTRRGVEFAAGAAARFTMGGNVLRPVLDHFQNPRNAGEIPNPDAAAEIENPACGDVLRLSLKMSDGRIAEARFKAKGCVPAMACGSALTELSCR